MQAHELAALLSPRSLRMGRAADDSFTKKQHLLAMTKEAKNVDFCTTGRQPSEQDFTRISEWIKWDKKK